MTLKIVSSFNGVSDPDAAAYIEAVEAADGELLEFAVGKAINDFVLGCKADGIWNAIKASCILAGARTLSGALVPLAGTAPTNFNFVAGDYNRKTGLVGDGSTKYLGSSRAENSDPLNNCHLSVYASKLHETFNGAGYIGSNTHNLTGFPTLFQTRYVSKNSSVARNTGGIVTGGLQSHSRDNSLSYKSLCSGIPNGLSDPSVSESSQEISVYKLPVSGLYSNARLAFYSIGESLDLDLLDNRVTTLINAFGVAIP
jgi:hypothetical protein